MGDALRAALEEDDRVILLGEDLVDPYGGAFKVTRGLSTEFPGRVRSTPISEGAIASSLVHDPAAVLRALLAQNRPVLLIEHKLLYPLHLMLPAGGRIEDDVAETQVSADGLPTVSIRPVARKDCSFSVLAYGYQAEL